MYVMTELRMESAWLNDNLTDAIKEDNNLAEKCSGIASDIKSKKLKLVTVVENLADVLTDMNPEIRVRGTYVLAQVLHSLPTDCLLRTELEYFTTFFCDRLKDHHSVVPAVLPGILTIAQMENVPEDMAVRVLTVMFQHISCQSLKIEDRRVLYKILQTFIYNSTEALKVLGPDFVFGVMNAIDGERDAQNLFILFQMLPYFIKKFPLGHLTEEMFEILACYFPVDYRAESNNKNAVSRDNLATTLTTCLTASPDFAELCFPLLLDKLDSNIKLSKLESFNVLVAGCDVFTIASIRPFLLELWRIIQREALPGSDKEVRTAGLDALRAIVHMLSVAPVGKEETKAFQTVLTYVMNAGLDSLKEVDMNLFVPAIHLFFSVCEASSEACKEVTKQVFPVLILQYSKESGSDQRLILLRAITSFVSLCNHQHVSPSEYPDLTSIWTSIPALYLAAAHDAQAEVCKEGIHSLSVIAKSLESKERQQLYDFLCKEILRNATQAIRDEINTCLKVLSKLYPEELMAVVQFALKTFEESSDENKVSQSLLALCEVADVEPFTSCVIPHVLNSITQSSDRNKCLTGLSAAKRLVKSSAAETNILSYLHVECNIVSRLASWCIDGVQQGLHPFTNESTGIIRDTAVIVDAVVKNQTVEIQSDVVCKTMAWFNISNSDDDTHHLLDHRSPTQHLQLVILLEGLLGSIRQEVTIPLRRTLISVLTRLATCTADTVTQESAYRLMANLINKAPNDEEFLKILSDVASCVKGDINGESSDPSVKLSASRLLVWVAKALVMRGHKEVDMWLEMLVEFLAHEVVGKEVAQGFKIILQYDEDFLTQSSSCNVGVLYKQRFFTTAPKLAANYRNAFSLVQPNYLTALANLQQGVPQEVLLMDFQQMVPLLVESLEQDMPTLVLTTLETLHNLLEVQHQALEDHVQTFIPRILKLSQFSKCMMVRMKALQCMHKFCRYPVEKILPFKGRVVQQIGLCLDDPKRLVRKEAARARGLWFVLGSSKKGEDS